MFRPYPDATVWKQIELNDRYGLRADNSESRTGLGFVKSSHINVSFFSFFPGKIMIGIIQIRTLDWSTYLLLMYLHYIYKIQIVMVGLVCCGRHYNAAAIILGRVSKIAQYVNNICFCYLA